MPDTSRVTSNRPKVCVSRCLLGDPVRYDGEAKPGGIVMDEMAVLFVLVPLCPEVEAGFGVPRPPVQLTGDLLAPRVTGRDDASLDVTARLRSFCDRRVMQLADVCGYILKSRSPSCGSGTTPLFIDGSMVTESSDGLFVRALKQHFPGIAIIDEIQLQDDRLRAGFVRQVASARDHHNAAAPRQGSGINGD